MLKHFPKILQENVFDIYVNAGRQAVLLLQQGLFDIDTKVSADGLVGLQMPKAAALVAEAASNYLNDACSVTLWNYYLNLGYF